MDADRARDQTNVTWAIQHLIDSGKRWEAFRLPEILSQLIFFLALGKRELDWNLSKYF